MFRGTRVQLLSVAVVPVGIGLAVTGAPAPQVQPDSQVAAVSFATQVAPLFAANCTSCHGTEEQEAGLQLHTYEAVMKGSEYGTVIEAGDPDNSLLLDMISAGEMPQDADALSDDDVDMVRSWIADGAQNN